MVVIEEADDGNESGGYSWGTPGEQHPQEQDDADSADRLLEQLEVLKAQANGRFKAGALQEALGAHACSVIAHTNGMLCRSIQSCPAAGRTSASQFETGAHGVIPFVMCE